VINVEAVRQFHSERQSADKPLRRFRNVKRTAAGVAAVTFILAGCASPTSALTTVTVTASPSQPAPTGPPSPRGLLSTEAEWDHLYGSATVAECVAQGFVGNIGADRAWRLPGGGLACVSDPSVGVWGDRVINATLYFDLHVDSKTATAVAASLLPSDAVQAGSVEQHNLNWSKYSDGSCQFIAFTSDALAEAVRKAVPDWNGGRNRADVKLFTGNVFIPDGADQPYRSEAVSVAR
jgi:hypothetical protein